MKKGVRCFLLAALFPLLLCMPAAAQESLRESIYAQSGAEEIAQALDAEQRELWEELTETETGASQGLFRYLKSTVLGTVKNLRALVMTVMACLICSAAFRLFSDAIGTQQIRDVLSMLCSALLCWVLFSSVQEQLQAVQNGLVTLRRVMNSITVALCAVTVMSGKLATASASRVGMSAFFSLVGTVADRVLRPAVNASLALGVLSLCSAPFSLESIGRMIRKCFLWVIGFLSTVLTAVLAFQKTIAAASDSLGIRGVKFAMGNLVPVVGTALSDAVTTVSAALGSVKGLVGGGGIAVLLVVLLQPLIRLLLFRGMCCLCAAAAELLALQREHTVLQTVGEISGFLAAILAFTGVLFMLQCGILAAGAAC